MNILKSAILSPTSPTAPFFKFHDELCNLNAKMALTKYLRMIDSHDFWVEGFSWSIFFATCSALAMKWGSLGATAVSSGTTEIPKALASRRKLFLCASDSHSLQS